uniref:Gig2-like protein DreE n=1 Tax=Danio rerio TaxID=7955 RepID=A0A2R9YJN9_DANRE|nr:grass carp reovirus (GCRV)-induced gene 2e [Danio rerio]ADZ76348.1 Gig2-like protein DreE [Danio rerio]|eukprot:NP_001232920.1 uncharacterized protein LOC100005283 [Danio rerio]
MWTESDLDPGVPCLQSSTVPEDGKVYRMYHGTTKTAAEKIRIQGFRASADGMLGPGVYLSRDLNKASRYPLDNPKERVVIRVKVNVGRVKRIDRQHHPLQKTWHAEGYDTAWCPPDCGMVTSGLEEDCVWDPKRITIIDIIPPSPQNISKINPEDPVEGKEYTMFHGTSIENAEKIKAHGFSQSKRGILGRGVYLSRDPEKAFNAPTHVTKLQRTVLRVKVNVGRVIKIDRQGHPLQKTWHCKGYDTAWYLPDCGLVNNGLEKDCVRDPRRITVIDIIPPSLRSIIPHDLEGLTMWKESDLDPDVPFLQSSTEPKNGKIYRMYHGTTKTAAEQIRIQGFRPSADGMLGRGVYLSRDLNKASRYPLDKPKERVVIRVKVNVGKVKKIDYQDHPLQKTWHAEGYDTAWCPPNCGMVSSGLEEDCVWDPKRITIIDIIPPSLQNSIPEDPVEGKEYTMFHGTSKENAEIIKAHGFSRSKKGILGRGVYLSRDPETAFSTLTHLTILERSVLRVKVNVGRVIKIAYHCHPLQKTWHCKGYDTAWFPPNCGMLNNGLGKDCVRDPTRITVIDVIRPV